MRAQRHEDLTATVGPVLSVELIPFWHVVASSGFVVEMPLYSLTTARIDPEVVPVTVTVVGPPAALARYQIEFTPPLTAWVHAPLTLSLTVVPASVRKRPTSRLPCTKAATPGSGGQ